MNLETYDDPADLYLARGEEVNPNRPIFTGDVFDEVAIADVQTGGLAIVVAHPCSFRVGGGQLRDRLLAALGLGPAADVPAGTPCESAHKPLLRKRSSGNHPPATCSVDALTAHGCIDP